MFTRRGARLRHLLIAWLLVAGLLLPLTAAAQDDADVVSTVNGEPITRADFQARVRFVRWQYLQELAKLHELTAGNLGISAGRVLTLVNDLRNSDQLGEAVLGQMEDDLLAAGAAAQLGVAPSPDDVAALRRSFFSLWTGVAEDAITTDADAQAFIASWYEAAQAASGLEPAQIDAVFATEALWDALFDAVAARAPTEELSVHSRHILCRFDDTTSSLLATPTADQRAAATECVRAAQTRLAGDEPFASVAAALSGDASSAARGGDLGWIPLSLLADGYAEAAETAPLNRVIGPVETEFGLHLIDVLERETRPLEEADLLAAQADLFDLWLATLREQATITRAEDWAADIPAEPTLDALDPAVQEAIAALETPD